MRHCYHCCQLLLLTLSPYCLQLLQEHLTPVVLLLLVLLLVLS
jgi:hypothetical protein